MIYTEETSDKIAEFLLQIKAIKLEPTNPFVWSSGWKSPIYCDNRISLSHPAIRTYIRQQLVKAIETHFEKPQTIAGVATGGIAHGVLVAQELGVPFVYVRPESKKHGMKNQVEGQLQNKSDVVVVEDLVSTGKSSLAVVDVLRNEGCDVKYMVSIFDYGFEETHILFEKHKVKLISLCDYSHLINKALEMEYIKTDHIELLKEWRNNPANWGKLG
ncbi:MAG: orotate phosphoribosyltransferase [Candidatus Competibacteraceae bacterium]|nr:orotate phosphoribosyltransferase [Candidatus Competibacteraceae bacterium]